MMGEAEDQWYVYILKCSNGKYYTGCTNNLDSRIEDHSEGKVNYTCKHLPIKLHFYCCFNNKDKAYAFEKYLKSGSGRAFASKRFL